MWNKFEFYRPSNLDEACSLLAEHGQNAAVLAGGTDLLVEMTEGKRRPRFIVSVKGLKELGSINQTRQGDLKIGSLVTLRTLETSPAIPEQFRIISYTASNMGCVQIRNSGTIGGNLCNAAPSADMSPVLLAMGAELKIHSINRDRNQPIDEFIVGPMKTVLNAGEILSEITIPQPHPHAGMSFIKFGVRNVMEVADLNICAVVNVDERDRCQNVRIALGGVAPTPIRAKKAEMVLEAQRPDTDTIMKAAETAAKEVSPRRRKEYKISLTKTLVKRALKQALEQSR